MKRPAKPQTEQPTTATTPISLDSRPHRALKSETATMEHQRPTTQNPHEQREMKPLSAKIIATLLTLALIALAACGGASEATEAPAPADANPAPTTQTQGYPHLRVPTRPTR